MAEDLTTLKCTDLPKGSPALTKKNRRQREETGALHNKAPIPL